MLVASGRASIFCYQTFRLTQDPIADPQKGKILMNMSLDPASVFEKFPKNHTKKSTSPMIFCIGPQILNETDIFNGTCGSFLCLGCFSELGFFSVNLAASSTWCFFVFFVVAFRFLFLEASVGFWMHPHFFYEKKRLAISKKRHFPSFESQESQWLLPATTLCYTTLPGLLYISGGASQSLHLSYAPFLRS